MRATPPRRTDRPSKGVRIERSHAGLDDVRADVLRRDLYA